jgi:hypothetical protein
LGILSTGFGNPNLPNGEAKPPTFTFAAGEARVRRMRILPSDQTVLDHVAAREAAIIGRAVDWAGVNSGSRNAAGLNAMLDLLEAEARLSAGRGRAHRHAGLDHRRRRRRGPRPRPTPTP